MPAQPDAELAVRLAKTIADLYGAAVDELLTIVARRLARGITDEGWAEAKLNELAQLRDEAQAIVERLEKEGPGAVVGAIGDAFEAGARAGAAEVGSGFVGTNREALRQYVEATLGRITEANGRILRDVQDAYRAIVAEAGLPGIITGSATRQQAAQRALDRFADAGVSSFVDRAGRRWSIESYVEMATRTGSAQAQVAGTLDRYQADGRDLVIVSDAPQECGVCRPWEGKVLSITGASPQGTRLSDGAVVAGSIAQARNAGLLHANCRHSLGAYIVGLTPRFGHTADPEGDRLRQQQRHLERGVRKWKRREAAALDPQAKARARRHRQQWEQALGEHVESNDLKRLRRREAIRPGEVDPPPRPSRPRQPRPSPTPEPVQAPPPRRPMTPHRDRVTFADRKAERRYGPILDRLDEIHGPGPSHVNIRQGAKTTSGRGGSYTPATRIAPKPRRPSRRRYPDTEGYRAAYAEWQQSMRDWRASPMEPLITIHDRAGEVDGSVFSFLHEYGHGLDIAGRYRGVDVVSHFDGAPMRLPRGAELDALDPMSLLDSDPEAGFLAAVRKTQAYADLGTSRDVSWANYARQPVELWARAYSQWAAGQLGDESALAGLRHLQQPGYKGFQWSDEEFETLAPFIEAILRRWELMP